MNCEICERIGNRKGLLYESDKVIVFIPEDTITPGELIVAPKDHFPILEAVPDYIISEMFIIANKVGTAVFEALGAQGTNILIQNGTAAGQEKPHVLLHVIPRKENDGLNLQWAPKKIDEDDMSTAELKIKEQTDSVGIVETEAKKAVEEEEPEKAEDYKVKSLERIP